MLYKRISALLFFISTGIFMCIGVVKADGPINGKDRTAITLHTQKMTMVINCSHKASITSLIINGQKVIDSADGIFTALTIKGITYSSLHLKTKPVLVKTHNGLRISGINYGDSNLNINETWTFATAGNSIKWNIIRKLSNAVEVEDASVPVFNFKSINTWEGAYQGYGGLAWFYLFNEKLSTYGVHSQSSDFWNSKTNNGLSVNVDAPGKKIAMKYSRTINDALTYSIAVTGKDMIPKLDSGTNRRRFLRGRTDVWSPFMMHAGTSSQTLTLTYFNFDEKYGRGKMVGVDGKQVSAVLNTIARIGVIDSLHFGGNSWATPYGPICLHEQYIAQLGLAINDPKYLNGYKSCLDYYRDHAILPDGRVYPRWAYTNEDAMPGRYNKDGFYEAQWGILLDSNPDFVTNVAELYDQTGDKQWVKSHQAACEKALDYLLKRDSNGNGLVEMMTDNHTEQKSSDWIDIIWASYENAFVNAKLYHALIKWADIERQLNNATKANYYQNFATQLKASFNKPTTEGGFWDEEKQCYDYWRDKDNTMHGRNMVTPVNFMAIAYGICDDDSRKKIILDALETEMQREKLFFWPLAMTTYTRDEGKGYQYPFPIYENGDLFLSWGSIAIKAYTEYRPELALKYVKNVLEQYSKDGLAYQRYGRVKQNGLGDDILSGNSLTVVGLYQAIYGINPLYNRLYLDPHITAELAGTELKYKFRDQSLTISLDNDSYSVANNLFKVTDNKKFGFNATKNQLIYFNDNSSVASMKVTTKSPLSIKIDQWNAEKREWHQTAVKASGNALAYTINQLKPNANYTVSVNDKAVQTIKSNSIGVLYFNHQMSGIIEKINIDSQN
jgi:hypothetical protein